MLYCLQVREQNRFCSIACVTCQCVLGVRANDLCEIDIYRCGILPNHKKSTTGKKGPQKKRLTISFVKTCLLSCPCFFNKKASVQAGMPILLLVVKSLLQKHTHEQFD